MWLLDFPYLKRRLVEFRKREQFLIVTQTFNHAMNGKVWNSIKNCILSSYLQHPLRKLKLVQLLDTNSRILALLFAQSLKSLRTKSHKITWNVLKKKLAIKHFCSLWAVSETLFVILNSSEGKNVTGRHDIYLSIHGLFDHANWILIKKNQLNFKFKLN